MIQPAVSFRGVSKKFSIDHSRSRTFQEVLVNLVHLGSRDHSSGREEFWALRDVSFEVPAGKTLGIVGDNGSGKSTTLKLISGILRPTCGIVQVNGRVSALLELGAGFHPDLTGRENVFLAGTILGMRQAEMRRRFDEIVDFSELGHVIDAPVRHYSSGMYMRLAFSVATAVDPDILLVDEVLAVGDASFQKRCLDRIKTFQKAGRTIILVSHDVTAIAEICSSALWLHQGSLRAQGLPNQVVSDYLEFTSLGTGVGGRGSVAGGRGAEDGQSSTNRRSPTPDAAHPVRITEVEVRGPDGNPRTLFNSREEMAISIGYAALPGTPKADFGVTILRSDGTYCYATNTRSDGVPAFQLQEKGEIRITFNPLTLLSGTFLIHAAIFEPIKRTHYDFLEHAAMFRVRSDRTDYGVCVLPHQWMPAGAATTKGSGPRTVE